ncbi:ester cyclase [Halomicroarcula sp. GCM10025324]|uniref:ester cyclase n=1 Tax=Haloarcula TaxID=2237 RepID=UPI0023E7EB77|nr:ester cyclase [Halomicroarcula sp. ZS-22-S1]
MAAVDSGSATGQSDEALVEAFLTAFVGGDAEAVADLVTEDCVLHEPRWPITRTGRSAIVDATGDNEGTFTDLDIRVERSVSADGEIAAYVTASGRNVGPVRMKGREIAPTGRPFEVPQFGHYRIEDGRIAEAWILADALGIVEQLDNFPKGPGKLLGIALRQVRWRLGSREYLD